jgi:tRNA(Ile)-lysidine synthetase-like protein
VRPSGQNTRVPTEILDAIDRFLRTHGLDDGDEPIACLVSGGADSTCLWHALRALNYDVRAVHVHHGTRGEDADADAEHCRRTMGAEIVRVRPGSGSEAELRALRYRATAHHPVRATGHTFDDQIETVVYRIVSSGSTRGIRPRRGDGVVRPLLEVTRTQTVRYCVANGLVVREDATNPGTKRGQIRSHVLPALRLLDPRADANLAALAGREPLLPRTLERTLAGLIESREGTARADLGGGVRAVREYDELRLEGAVEWGPWRLEASRSGLSVRRRRPGDRLSGRRRKVQDLMVDAKVPRAARADWPLVVSGDEVVAVPGIAEAPGWEGIVTATREEER